MTQESVSGGLFILDFQALVKKTTIITFAAKNSCDRCGNIQITSSTLLCRTDYFKPKLIGHSEIEQGTGASLNFKQSIIWHHHMNDHV